MPPRPGSPVGGHSVSPEPGKVGNGARRRDCPLVWSRMVEPMNPAVNPAARITRVRIISYLQFDGEVWTAATGLSWIDDHVAARSRCTGGRISPGLYGILDRR